MKSKIGAVALLGALLISLILCVVGFTQIAKGLPPNTLIAGAISLVLTLAGYGVTCQLVHAMRMNAEQFRDFRSVVAERLEQFSVMLNMISEQQLISERAKSIAFRDKDRDALERAIREETSRGQYDAAMLLVNEMEASFAYRQDAAQLREEVTQQRDSSIRRAVSEAITEIDRDCASEKWDAAMEMAQKISSTYPGHELTAALPEQVQQRKEAVKQQLLQRWREAVARKDIDGSIEVLRALDLYVTPSEVAQLKDGALEIFKARIEQLRERFKTAVQEKRWIDALQVGEDIVQDFPTSKLAQEVRDMTEMLRTRASEPIGASA